MPLTLHFLLWGSIAASVSFVFTSNQLAGALKRNWKRLSIIVLLALFWRLPFDGHFFYGLEYEDSYIYPVAARYLASRGSPGTFLTTICVVGNLGSCGVPETSSGHFIGYPFMIAIASKIFGYSSLIASCISIASSLLTGVIVFLLGELIAPGGVSGIAGALVFSFTPLFAVYGAGTYAEPVSNLLVVTCLLMCLCLLTPSTPLSPTESLVTFKRCFRPDDFRVTGDGGRASVREPICKVCGMTVSIHQCLARQSACVPDTASETAEAYTLELAK